jgi:hypothetical protein
MSLEEALAENTKWLEKVHVELMIANNLAKDKAIKPDFSKMPDAGADLPKEVKKEAKAEKPPKEEKKVEPVKEETKGPTLADAQKAITHLCSKMGSDEGRAILKEFKAERVSSLDPKDFGKFIKRCEASLAML